MECVHQAYSDEIDRLAKVAGKLVLDGKSIATEAETKKIIDEVNQICDDWSAYTRKPLDLD